MEKINNYFDVGGEREGGSMAIKDYLNIKYTHFGISY